MLRTSILKNLFAIKHFSFAYAISYRSELVSNGFLAIHNRLLKQILKIDDGSTVKLERATFVVLCTFVLVIKMALDIVNKTYSGFINDIFFTFGLYFIFYRQKKDSYTCFRECRSLLFSLSLIKGISYLYQLFDFQTHFCSTVLSSSGICAISSNRISFATSFNQNSGFTDSFCY